MAQRIQIALRPVVSAASPLFLRARPRLDLPPSCASSPAQPWEGRSASLSRGFGEICWATLARLGPARPHQVRSDAGPLGFRRALSLCLLLSSMNMFQSTTASSLSSHPSLASTCLSSPGSLFASSFGYSRGFSSLASSHPDLVDSSRLSAADNMGSLPGAIPPFKVFVAGTSYAGLSTTLNLLDLSRGEQPRLAHAPYEHHPDFTNVPLEITIADERDGFFHLIGSPLAFADANYAAKSWVKFQDIPSLQRPNVRFVQGSVTKVDPATKTATVLDHVTKEPQEHTYDFFIGASGLRRQFPAAPQSLTRKQFLLEAENHIHNVRNAPDGVVVVGGGAVGIEMAAELKLVEPNTKVTLVHSRDKLLSSEGLSDECKDKALELTLEAGVEVLLGHRLKETRKLDEPAVNGRARYEVEFTNGHKIVASEVVMAISRSVPSTEYLPAAARDEEGYVKIHPSLVFSGDIPNASDHIAVGDIGLWSGIKRCGTAMHQGHMAAINAHQLMLAKLTGQAHKPKFVELTHVDPMIGLAVGKKAVASSPTTGTQWGEDVMWSYFRDDLGFTICWNHMKLGKVDN
ncbi:hypothetical protein CMUS01_04390 [Colletotrichum musicola]|uniref:FAD/NAD(P)-binding domain-containing protein n=1 Tax=Colletotrichum musicola TaxID=2175873 RepID=A0A8H6KXM1_9PEZI|nr:hypothetical protein CMUS01_04390 [Colletotrichum musicola]